MEIHQLEGHIQSIFLAVYPKKILLLDGCCRSDVRIVKQYIETYLQRSMRELQLIVVTHMHPDHAGGAMSFRKKYGIPIASSDADSHWYAGLKGAANHLIDLSLAYWVAHRMERPWRWLWYDKFLEPDFHLADGDHLPGFSDWEVVATPGHTDRDLSLFHPGSKQIYVADNILRVKDAFIPPFPVMFPDSFRSSLDRYRHLDIEHIYMAHGGKAKFDASCIDDIKSRVSDRPPYHKLAWGIIKSFANKNRSAG